MIASRYLILACIVGAALPACSSDSGTNLPASNDPPTLPPVASMQADLGLFTAGGPGEASANTQLNFGNAAFRLTLINAVTVLNMAIPVATFAAAAQNDPVFGSDGRFHWRYSVQASGQSFTADLSGTVAGGNTIWEMRLTTTGTQNPLDNFLWYSGTAQIGNGSGTWRVFDPESPGSQVEVLRIDWEQVSETDRTLQFTVTGPGDNNGDQLTFDVDGDSRTVTLVDSSASETLVIEWNAVTGAGSIIAPGIQWAARRPVGIQPRRTWPVRRRLPVQYKRNSEGGRLRDVLHSGTNRTLPTPVCFRSAPEPLMCPGRATHTTEDSRRRSTIRPSTVRFLAVFEEPSQTRQPALRACARKASR